MTPPVHMRSVRAANSPRTCAGCFRVEGSTEAISLGPGKGDYDEVKTFTIVAKLDYTDLAARLLVMLSM